MWSSSSCPSWTLWSPLPPPPPLGAKLGDPGNSAAAAGPGAWEKLPASGVNLQYVKPRWVESRLEAFCCKGKVVETNSSKNVAYCCKGKVRKTTPSARVAIIRGKNSQLFFQKNPLSAQNFVNILVVVVSSFFASIKLIPR